MNDMAWSPASSDENGAETDGTEWCHICFHIFFYGSENEYRNPKNKYENRYRRKQRPNMARRRNMIQMVAEIRNSLNHAEKFKQLKKTNKLVL